MFGSVRAKWMVVGVLLGALLSGCGTNPYGYGADGLAYGEAGYGYDSGYGDSYGGGYDSGYDSGYGSGGYDSGYDSGGYDSGYDTGYGGGYDTGYDSGYGSDYGTDYGSDYGSGLPGASPSPKPTTAPPSFVDRPALSAWVIDVKETGLLGMGGVVAKVEIENPTDRTLSGKLEVRFLDGGHLTPNKQTRRVTLRPLEKQVLTFSAKGMRLDDAEAMIETEGVDRPSTGEQAGSGDSVVRDRS